MSYALEPYYHLLGLVPSATQEDIKSQYKQLVRTHHPDRFIDPDEKAVAEEHLKSINEAYRVLSSQAVQGQLVKYMQQELGLVVAPNLLDFGLLDRRQQQRATFQVQFEKDVESVDFVPSEENSWFRVARVSHLYGEERASLEFEVEVDSTGLPAQTYQGWIDVYLDSTMTRMPLTMQVAQGDKLLAGVGLQQLARVRLPRRWALSLTFVLALLIFTTAFAFTSTRSFSQPKLGVAEANSAFEHVLGARTNQLYFSLLDQGNPSIYTALSQTAELPLLLTEGSQAAVLAEEQLLAYLHMENGQPQIFLWDQSADSTQQITFDAAAKRELTWSNDGHRLAYLVGSGEATRIGVYDREKEQEYRLPGEVTAGVSNFAWAPERSTLLFDLWQNNERRVYQMDVPNGELEQLTQFDSWAGTWSPDGRELIVASAQGLYRLDSSGRNLRQISNMPADQPRWSADGAWLAYTTEPLNHATDAVATESAGSTVAVHDLWIMKPDGTNLRQVATNSLWHMWSPTGEFLGYVTGSRNSPQTTDADSALFYLWTLTPSGTSQLIAEINEPFFSWSK